eukprot:gene8856-6236_t
MGRTCLFDLPLTPKGKGFAGLSPDHVKQVCIEAPARFGGSGTSRRGTQRVLCKGASMAVVMCGAGSNSDASPHEAAAQWYEHLCRNVPSDSLLEEQRGRGAELSSFCYTGRAAAFETPSTLWGMMASEVEGASLPGRAARRLRRGGASLCDVSSSETAAASNAGVGAHPGPSSSDAAFINFPASYRSYPSHRKNNSKGFGFGACVGRPDVLQKNFEATICKSGKLFLVIPSATGVNNFNELNLIVLLNNYCKAASYQMYQILSIFRIIIVVYCTPQTNKIFLIHRSTWQNQLNNKNNFLPFLFFQKKKENGKKPNLYLCNGTLCSFCGMPCFLNPHSHKFYVFLVVAFQKTKISEERNTNDLYAIVNIKRLTRGSSEIIGVFFYTKTGGGSKKQELSNFDKSYQKGMILINYHRFYHYLAIYIEEIFFEQKDIDILDFEEAFFFLDLFILLFVIKNQSKLESIGEDKPKINDINDNNNSEINNNNYYY